MLLPPLKTNFSANTDSVQTPVRKPNTAQELARLRRLEDLRGQMHDLRPSLAPPPRPMGYGQLAQSPSAPTLHDFSTKTHLARLDLAYERLDAHVEQCMQQMRVAMSEQQQNMEDWLQHRLAAVGKIQVQGPAAENQGIEIRSLALQDSEIWKKICSMEERLGKGAGVALTDPTMLSRLAAVEDRVTKICPLLESEVRTIQERIAAKAVTDADLHEKVVGFEALIAEKIAQSSSGDVLFQDVGARLLDLEMKLAEATAGGEDVGARFLELERKVAEEPPRDVMTDTKFAEFEQQTSAKLAELEQQTSATDGKLAELEQQTSALSSKTDGKLVELEQQNSALSATCGEIRSAFETAIGDLTREVSDQAVAKDMKFKVLETRIDGLQAGVGNLSTQMEADRAKEIQEKSTDPTTLEKQISVIDGINDRISQALAAESTAAMEKQMSVIDERISQAEQTNTGIQKDVVDLKEQIESKLSERLEAVEQNLSQCVKSLQAGLDELSQTVQLRPKGENAQAPVQNGNQLPLQPVPEEQAVTGFRVGDRVQSKEYGNLGTVIAVDADGDPKLRFDDGSVDQKYARDFKVIQAAVEPVQVAASGQPSELPPQPVREEQAQVRVEQAQVLVEQAPVVASSQPELRPQPQPSEQVQGSVSQPTGGSSVAGIYALDSNNENKRQPQGIEQTPYDAKPVEKPEQIASGETRNVRLDSAPNAEMLANESKPSPPVAENKTLIRDQDTRVDASKDNGQYPEKPLREEMPVSPEAPVRADQKQAPNPEQGRDVSKAPIKFNEVVAEDTTSNAESFTGPRLLAKSIESNQGIRFQEEARGSPQESQISNIEPSQMSVLANLDRTALRIEDRVSSLDSRLQLAVEAIETNKAESDSKFNALETRLPEITKQEYDELQRRLQTVEKEGAATSSRKTRSLSPTRNKPESSDFDAPMFSSRSSPVDLQDADKRTVAAAVVMMEKKLEGYVTMDAFNDLRENMQDGLENIGERIKSAHESQIQKTEAMLTQLLESRRQKSRGGKRLKTPPQDSENIASEPNASSIETSAVLPEGSSTTGIPQDSPSTQRRALGTPPEEPLPSMRPSVVAQF